MKQIKSVILLGSGALKIGEAGEFDYSGSQAIKALKEEGVRVILVNPNIATIQTSEKMADEVYFVPVTPFFVEEVIRKEKPDGILLSFGGQTALNCGLDLHKNGVLDKYHVQVLGTPIEAIEATEDREIFARRLEKLGVATAKGKIVATIEEAKSVAASIGYPIMVRSGFALGGAGSGVAHTEEQLLQLSERSLATGRQMIVEESLKGWKEVEYEVVRDKQDNCITVCNMENFDPVGIHTGESIVVAPSQTLTNEEYYSLRQKSINVIRDLKIVGECNIQFALHPTSSEVRVIEVNARLSRSSALASKATGYPLAYVAAKLALGKTLPELPNKITGQTTAFFEPALDYVVVKMPRWDLDKFTHVNPELGSEMKSVGEVMSIGRSFEEAIQKAARMLNDGYSGVIDPQFLETDKAKLLAQIQTPTSLRLFTICTALAAGVTAEQVSDVTGIDLWFLRKLNNIVDTFQVLRKTKKWSPEQIREAKERGFSDQQLADISGISMRDMRQKRVEAGIVPCIKRIDTMAGEFPARTNYLYMTYAGNVSDHMPETTKERAIVLGCGPYSIGTSVEFDWCAVNTVNTFRESGIHTVMINCNPETVSTDYDISDTLYFEELSLERVLDIIDYEHAPVVVSVGGQIPNNLAPKLYAYGATIMGTSPEQIHRAEYRKSFSALLDTLNLNQPAWTEATSSRQALVKAKEIGYPVLVRPSFVLSGRAMSILDSEQELERYLVNLELDLTEYPLVISKFLSGAREFDFDGVAQDGKILVSAISQHIEGGGVHSGDSTIVYPTFSADEATLGIIRGYTEMIVKELMVSGPFNIQFLHWQDEPYVIECNLRASRSMPLVSKAMKVNFMQVVAQVLLEKKDIPIPQIRTGFYTVKVPQFSFHKLRGADPVARVEMTSTGEVAAMGTDVSEAYLKATLSTGVRYPTKKAVFVSLGGAKAKLAFLSTCTDLVKAGYTIYTTSGTHLFLKEYGVESQRVGKIFEGVHPNASDLLQDRLIDFMVVIPEKQRDHRTMSTFEKTLSDGYQLRRKAIDLGLPVYTNLASAIFFVATILKYRPETLTIAPWSNYGSPVKGV